MSRIGKQPISIPSGVKVEVNGKNVAVSGSKGNLDLDFRDDVVSVAVEDNKVVVTRKSDEKFARAMHGTTQRLIANMVKGVTDGFQKNLDIHGVGWQAKLVGKMLSMQLGFCHTVDMNIPEGLQVNVPNPQRIEVIGINKQMVGEFAASVRASRKPEPYKGKGVRYMDEVVVRKAGKSFVGGK
ncbi:MAG: 50S ribosomal protein L6 [Planctomycetes bacterium]|nr:50S ribosomal protein L6 [Planctomycetota bacterium]